ncbi:unnamed protein product [Staurois parvus]|uniref:Uncharacterized protein n=1 Tax=Staurois parvus TaxID=386267 RepID=A0ABN9AD53_9NEOB|nr:unnamed protein product [Staurois parvus]
MREVEINYKCLNRWHITPNVEHKMNTEISQMCWRGCGEVGTWYHMWWECPEIQVFWRKIVYLIGKITKIKIGLDPELCLLHISELSVKAYKSSGIWHYLTAAKSLIPRFWKKREVPNEEDWTGRVNQIAGTERLYYTHEDKLEMYNKKWKGWEEYRERVKYMKR